MSTFAAQPMGEFLASIAAKSPTPGGGAVASTAGALSAALAHMVVSYSLGKKNLAPHQPQLEAAANALARARRLLLQLADEDAAAYGLVNELSRLPHDDPRRASELAPACQAAVQVPMAVIATCVDLLRLFGQLAPITNKHLASDLGIAGELAKSTVDASIWNVEINVGTLPPQDRDRALEQADALRAKATSLSARLADACMATVRGLRA